MIEKRDSNCDIGESFGHYRLGQDVEVMPYITTANIAAGYHAGNPHVMDDIVALADERAERLYNRVSALPASSVTSLLRDVNE